MSGFLEVILPHAVPFALVLARFSGLFVFAPMLTTLSAPMSAKALLAASMTLAVYPGVALVAPQPESLALMSLAPLLAMELAIGAALGLIASVPVLAVQAAGHVMGYQMGLGIAQVYNPELDVQSDALAELLFFIGFAAFVALDGLEALFVALTESFVSIPPGALGPGAVPAELYLGLIGSGFELMLRVSAPATAAIVLILLAMGVLMKTMPALNVLTVGFAIKIIAGILVIASAVAMIDEAARDAVGDALDAALSWVAAPDTHDAGGAGPEVNGG